MNDAIKNHNYAIQSLRGTMYDLYEQILEGVVVTGPGGGRDKIYTITIDSNGAIQKSPRDETMWDNGQGTDKDGRELFYTLEQRPESDGPRIYVKCVDDVMEKEYYSPYYRINAIHKGISYGHDPTTMCTWMIRDMESGLAENVCHMNTNDPLMFVIIFKDQLYLGYHSGLKVRLEAGTYNTIIRTGNFKPCCAVATPHILYVGCLGGQILALAIGAQDQLELKQELATCPLIGHRIRALVYEEGYLFVLGDNGQLFAYHIQNEDWILLEDLKQWTYGFDSLKSMLYYQGVLYILTDRALHALIFGGTGSDWQQKLKNTFQRHHPGRSIRNAFTDANNNLARGIGVVSTGGMSEKSHC